MPRSCGLMRPSALTAEASVSTSDAPPVARDPRWTKCQSLEKPSTLEYWHIGDTTMRLDRVTERRLNGSKRCGIDPLCHPFSRTSPSLRFPSPRCPPLRGDVIESGAAKLCVAVTRHRQADVDRRPERDRRRSDLGPGGAVRRL